MSASSEARPAMRRVAVALLAAGVFAIMAIAVLLAFYTQPMNDDYTFSRMAVNGHDNPVTAGAAMATWGYHTFCGRFTGLFATGAIFFLVEQTMGGITVAYWSGCLLLLCTGIAATWFFAATLLGPNRAGAAAWFTAVFWGLFISGRPHPREGLYWLGGLGYICAFTLLPLYWAVVYRALAAPRTAGIAITAGAGLLAVAAAGIHEALTPLLLVMHAMTWHLSRCCWPQRHAERRRVLRVVLGGLILGVTVTLVAPGNFNRFTAKQNQLNEQPEAGTSLSGEIVETVKRNVNWVLDYRLPLLALALFPILKNLIRRMPPYRDTMRMIPWLPVLACGAILLSKCETLIVYHAAPPFRFESMLYYPWLMLMLAAATLWLWRWQTTSDTDLAERLQPAAAILLAGCLLTSVNTISMAADLARRAPEWHRQMQARFALLRQPGDTVDVPAITVHPRNLAFDSQATKPSFEALPLAGYFTKKIVRITPATVPAQSREAP